MWGDSSKACEPRTRRARSPIDSLYVTCAEVSKSYVPWTLHHMRSLSPDSSRTLSPKTADLQACLNFTPKGHPLLANMATKVVDKVVEVTINFTPGLSPNPRADLRRFRLGCRLHSGTRIRRIRDLRYPRAGSPTATTAHQDQVDLPLTRSNRACCFFHGLTKKPLMRRQKGTATTFTHLTAHGNLHSRGWPGLRVEAVLRSRQLSQTYILLSIKNLTRKNFLASLLT